VTVNPAAIPEALVESELFGHEKGAFTDAKDRRLGKLELAHGGSVFFDEIGDMPPELQVKLLRALQERAFERVGGHELIRMDVRVLAATHRDLEAMMKTERFREDLFYRLNVVTLSLPALRDRRGDIPLLAEHFLAKYAETLGERVVASDAMDRLVGYDWPGNVRELENVIQRAMVMASTGVILPEHLPIGPVSAAAAVGTDASLEEIIEICRAVPWVSPCIDFAHLHARTNGGLTDADGLDGRVLAEALEGGPDPEQIAVDTHVHTVEAGAYRAALQLSEVDGRRYVDKSWRIR